MKRLINRLIERLTTLRESEIIIGDMCEEYNTRLKNNSKLKADIYYALDFVTLITNHALKRNSRTTSNPFSMLPNNFKVALRQLSRQKLHNGINIAGLAIGLAVSFVISLYVVQELSYDKFHEKRDRIYLLPMTWKFATTQLPISSTTPAAGPVMKELFNKEIETYVRMQHMNMVFNGDQGPVVEANIEAVDSTFLNVFTYPMIQGNGETALREPNSMVLTERAAVKYFGEAWAKNDVMSKMLQEQSGKLYKITGVLRDPPVTSHMPFDVLVSMSSLPRKQWEPNWDGSSMITYVLLDKNASASEIVADIPKRVADKYGAEHNNYVELDLVPLADVYLRNQKYADQRGSDIRYVYIFSAIAALILLIAIINYMNLSTARSMERAKEVGVRKVVGALRRELFWQFISESILVTFAAVVMAVLIAYLLLPVFNNISSKSLEINFNKQPEWIAVLAATWLAISFLGGAYPATVLSSFRPAKVLKGKLGSIGSGAFLRKSLVVFQFAISIFLIVCTLTINNQLAYMVNKKIGIDKERLVSIQLDSLAKAHLPTIQNEFRSIIGVERMAETSASPITAGAKATVVGGDIGDKQLLIYDLGVDGNFASTSGLEIVAGTDLSPENPKDGTWEYLINESAVKFFGWTNETAVGKRMSLWQLEGVVKGVVRDYHFLMLRKPIEPQIIHAGKGNNGYLNKLLIRVDNNNFDGITAAMEERWKKLVPGSPMTVVFVDDLYRNVLYRSEVQLRDLMNIFSILAIFIAVLGLFGLASYSIMLRTKELGIRKVLGASLSRLMVVVSGNFVTLVTIAFVVAAPLSWYVMDQWLSNFAYPVGFNWLIVIGAGTMAILVAAGTVLYHAFEAARVNPAVTLRSE
jgi:putative ABC transport system permease protein